MINITPFIDGLDVDVLKYTDITNSLDLSTRPDLTSAHDLT